jgi:hypothetical protein
LPSLLYFDFCNDDECDILVSKVDGIFKRSLAMKTSPSEERRKSVRINGRKEAILIHPNGIDQIGDISLGGLSFHCSREEFFADQWPVDIIFAGTPLYIPGVSVRLVGEQQDNVLNFLTLPTKKVAVEFLELDEQNRFLLTKLISYLDDKGQGAHRALS